MTKTFETPAAPLGPMTPPKGIAVRFPWQRNLLTFLLVVGPGLIVMAADNDAGAVSTYTQAGAQYGTHLLWLLILLLPTCYFIQEMVARLGIATGQGHAAMIYQRFGKAWGVFSLVDLLLVNFLTLVTEFAGVSLAATQMGLSPVLVVPLAAVALMALVTTGSYRKWERMTIALCLLNLTWLALAWACHPRVGEALHHLVVPNVPRGGLTSGLVFTIIAIVGTTIAPWQLFFQQSTVADKKLRFADLKWARLDTFLGACLTVVVAGCMMLVGDAAYRHQVPFHADRFDPAKMAVSLGHIFGPWFKTGILLMMIDAAVLGATAISLASAYAYGEVRGWSHGLQKSVKEAPGFYGMYVVCVALAAGLVLIPRAPLQLIIIGVQVLSGVMLPSAIIFLQLLLNDRELLGPQWANKPWNNVVNWTIIVVLFALSLVLTLQVVAPNLFPAS
ncbi:MAG: Nramp family divalent metal transporter [Armatimonadota bacterium]|nr:Nramp family divalent metal transporter [Armatimonadota bacterium]